MVVSSVWDDMWLSLLCDDMWLPPQCWTCRCDHCVGWHVIASTVCDDMCL